MSFWAAWRLAKRSERLSPGRSTPSARTSAARRFTEPRTWMAAITPNVSVAAARNTSRLSITVGLSADISGSRSRMARTALDPEIDHAIHHEIAHQHPAGRHPEADPGDVVLPDAAVELRRHVTDHEENGDRQPGQEQRGKLSFRRQRLDLAAHLEPVADDSREVFQDLAQVAAGRALDRHRGDEQRQVLLADAIGEVAHRGFQVSPVGDLVGDDAELGADRIGQLARHHGDGDGHRMAGPQAAYDDVDGVGKLR